MIHIGGPYYEKPLFVDRHWLRDACECSMCVDPDSGQKNFGTCDVPTELPIEGLPKIEDGVLEVIWENDFLSSGNHVSRYPLTILQKDILQPLPVKTLWDKAIFERDRLNIDYGEWMAGEEGFLSGLHRLHTHGMLFLRNVPSSEECVISIANQIGNLQETFYGRTWDVRSKPNAENIAYTSSFLGLHQDLLYMKDTPRIQILHCLENTCEGGDSLFSDGQRAVNLIRIGPAQSQYHLSSIPLRYHYTKHGHCYQIDRSILQKERERFFWSPPFQTSRGGSFHGKNGSTRYRRWLKAATKFRQFLEDDQWVYQYKLQPGECVIFDNLRVVHGRRKFDAATGSRWLKGAYISNDVFKSKCTALNPQLRALGGGNELTPTQQASRFDEEYNIWEKEDSTKS
ncbi:Clavaminate synthase-like protein [Hypoxylon sp. EC38]|nr:Clavaminate synthase-like protein [Hypoxylon sp. EC38]